MFDLFSFFMGLMEIFHERFYKECIKNNPTNSDFDNLMIHILYTMSSRYDGCRINNGTTTVENPFIRQIRVPWPSSL